MTTKKTDKISCETAILHHPFIALLYSAMAEDFDVSK